METMETHEEKSLSNTPTMFIQCDWEDFIEVPHKTVWVSCKFLGEKSANGNIRGGTMTCNNNDFSATLGKNSVCLRFNSTGHICHFIPAFKQFQKIHECQAILSLDAANGGLGVSVARSGKLLVWDNSTGEVRRELTGHLGEVNKCQFFPSGIVVLSAGADMLIKIWSAESGACPVTLKGHTRAVTDVAVVDRGRNIVSVSKDGTARLWHCGDATYIDTVLSNGDSFSCCTLGVLPTGLASHPSSGNPRDVGTENKLLVVGSEEGNIYGVLLSSRRITFVTNCASEVNCLVSFSQDLLAVGVQDGRCIFYNLKDGSPFKVIHESNSPVLCLALFYGKGVLIGRHDGTVTYINPLSDTSDRIQLTGPNCDPVYSIAVTTKDIYTGCRDGYVRKYQVNDLLAAGV